MPEIARARQIIYVKIENLSVTDFFHISLTARNNRTITPITTPQKICWMDGFVISSDRIDANNTIAKNAGKTIPTVAAIAPFVPKSFLPVKMAVFAAIIPGKDAPSA